METNICEYSDIIFFIIKLPELLAVGVHQFGQVVVEVSQQFQRTLPGPLKLRSIRLDKINQNI